MGQTLHLSAGNATPARRELRAAGGAASQSPDRRLHLLLSIDAFQDFSFVFLKHISAHETQRHEWDHISRLVAMKS